MPKNLIVIGGPTASGKTDFSVWLAKKLKTQIISCDSRQIYKEMFIGTARPTEEEMQGIPHHFIGVKSVTEYYNASMYENEAIELINKLFRKYDNLIMVGGSGLYVDAIVYGIDDIPTVDMEIRKQLAAEFEQYGIEHLRQQLKLLDPVYYQQVDLNNPKRLLKALEITIQTGKPYSSFLTGKNKKRPFNIILTATERPRQELYDRINRRVVQMIEQGLVDEVKSLEKYKHLTALKTVGYREIFDYLEGKTTLDQAIDLIQRNTRKYARRQISWFRRYKDIKWFSPGDKQDFLQWLEKQL